MNDHDESFDDLGVLIADAVADVEPADRLDEIRRATSQARRTRRTWYAGGGALLAAAALVTAFVVMSPGDDGASDPIAKDPGGPVSVYYVGPGPDGPDAPDQVLYRYTETGTDPLSLLMDTPSDPDYRTLWPVGSLLSYRVESSRIAVEVSDNQVVNDDLARQQLIYTLHDATDTQLPVEPELTGGITIPTKPIAKVPQLDVLSHMSIDEPAEGQAVTGSFTATGRSNGFEASVACWLYVGDDGGSYGPYVTTAEGWMEERLFPWRRKVDLRQVPAGQYSFECTTDDPTGGTEGVGAYTDTRTITVE